MIKAQYFGYALVTATTLIMLGFMGVAVPAFRPGFTLLVLLIFIAAVIFTLFGYKLIIAEQSYYSRNDMRKALIPGIISLLIAGSLLSIGIFIAMRP